MAYDPNYRQTRAAEPSHFIGAANATYLAKTGGGTCATLQEVVASLAVGAIAIITDKQVLVTTATTAANIAGSNSFKILYRTSDGVLRNTPMISRGALWYGPLAAVAAVKRNQVIGGTLIAAMNLPATLAVGDVATLIVTNTKYPQQSGNGDVKVYEVKAIAGDTFITLTTKLIAAVNADPQRIVDAVAIMDGLNVAGIRLTAVDFGSVFEVGSDGVLANAQKHRDGTTESSSVGVTGQNLYSQLRRVAEDAELTAGRQFTGTRDQAQWWSATNVVDEMIPTKVDTATGLTTYNWVASNSGNMGAAQRTEGTQTNYTLAFVPGTAVLTSFNTIAPILFTVPSDLLIGG